MHLFEMKYGSAHVACLSLFLVGAMSVMAQEPDEAKEVASDTSIAVATHEANEGIMYNVPLVPTEMQKQGMTAASFRVRRRPLAALWRHPLTRHRIPARTGGMADLL
jgi:hypothetical protein